VDFEEVHPDRFFDLGVAEKNMVSLAAGLAAVGKIPYVATYAPFLALLCCEQIRTDIAYPGLKVRLFGTHSGLGLGFLGPSHHAAEDIAIMRSIAGMTVVCLADGQSIRAALETSVDYPGPIYFRVGRGRDRITYSEPIRDFRIGSAISLREGKDLTIFSNGVPLAACLEAAIQLEEEGIHVAVLDMHTIKPLDVEAVRTAAQSTGVILTVEEHSLIGGLGSAIAEVLAESGIPCRFKRHGIPDTYAPIAPAPTLLAHFGLDAAGVAKAVRDLIG
jgi:transketolase